MPRPSKKRRRPHINFHFTDREFAPYAMAIGQAALAWNYLQEVLATLFESATGSDTNMRAVWYSQANDRPRIQMLRAAISDLKPLSLRPEEHAKFCELAIWLCKETTKLNDDRNILVHSPFIALSHDLAGAVGEKAGVTPYASRGNPNAAKLKPKDPLIEFRWLRDSATVLSRFGIELNYAWELVDALPGKPRMPTREDQRGRRGPRRPLHAPRSSRG